MFPPVWNSHDHSHGYHHDKNHVHDHNHKSALIHVIADAFTSLLAIFALLLGKYFGWNWADPMMGIVGAVVILKWAYGLIKNTSWELLDGKSTLISEDEVKKLILSVEGVELLNLHIWRIAPSAHACELVVSNKTMRGSAYYKKLLINKFPIEHLVVEEQVIK